MNIIFMGTPEFAVPTLQKLIESQKHKIQAVFTSPPKAKGRGMKLINTPIYNIATAHGLKVFTPNTLKTEEIYKLIKTIEADIIVIVAYGFIIPPNILDIKKYGCLNIHPSKLPKYRGAAPLQRTIINGDTTTAVCIMQMDEGVDTGDVILQKNIDINSKTTLQELHDLCSQIGADLLLDVLDKIDSLPRIKQPSENALYAHKLTKEEGKVNWSESAAQIERKIRGMNPWPGVYFYHDGKVIKILAADAVDKEHELTPGQLINDNFDVACGKGILQISLVKPEGKSQMKARDYLHGLSISSKQAILG